jgi:hypothetical protein
MAAFDYIESRTDADELIEEFGRTIAIRRITNSGPPWEPTQTETDFPTFAVRLAFTLKQLQTRNVQATDQRWLVAAGPLAALGITEVHPTDKLVIDGVALEIAPLDPLQPATVPVLFDCQVKG